MRALGPQGLLNQQRPLLLWPSLPIPGRSAEVGGHESDGVSGQWSLVCQLALFLEALKQASPQNSSPLP